jgi:hypothetical protein
MTAKIDPAIDPASGVVVCAYDADRRLTFDVKFVRARARAGLPTSGPRGGCRLWERPIGQRKSLK